MRSTLWTVVAVLAMTVLMTGTVFAGSANALSLKGAAGRFNTTTWQHLGNSTDAQASWTNKARLDGKFSMLLQKTTNDQWSYAAAIVNGVEGMTVAELGDLAFSFTGPCSGGSPRFNLYFDSDGDGAANGIAFLGCNNVALTSPAPGWSTATFPSADVQAWPHGYDFNPAGPYTLSGSATVVSLSVLIDIVGTHHLDRVSVDGVATGEPNGK
jgi:hypothetical protein